MNQDQAAHHLTGQALGRGIAALSLWLLMGCGDKLAKDRACSIPSESTGQTKLLSCDPDSGEMFGSAVALSRDGRTALVGVRTDESTASKGAADVFVKDERGQWTQQEKLRSKTLGCDPRTPTSSGSCDLDFGALVALSGDGNTALVGSYHTHWQWQFPGGRYPIAHVFVRDGAGAWTEQPSIMLPSAIGDGGDRSWSAALSRDGLTVLGTIPNPESAAVSYVRGGTGTGAPQMMQATGTSFRLWAVALSGDGKTALLGAGPPDNLAQRSAAYVFTRDNVGSWTLQQQLGASDGASKDHFGAAVALSDDGNTAFIANRAYGSRTGAAYVFGNASGGGWTEKQRLLAREHLDGDLVSTAVALSGDGNTALLGAQSTKSIGTLPTCAVYLFTQDGTATWTERPPLVAADQLDGDGFGAAVALSGDGHTALIGAPNADSAEATHKGAAYLITLN